MNKTKTYTPKGESKMPELRTLERLQDDLAQKTPGTEIFQDKLPFTIRVVVGRYLYLDNDVAEGLKNEHIYFTGNNEYPTFSRNSQDVRVHNFVCPSFTFVDHKNRDKLDCRRVNLREISRGANSQNAEKHKDSTQQYKGAYPIRGKWQGRIQKDKRVYSKGGFDTAEAAARWYDSMVDKLFPGGFKNFP